MKRSIAVVVFGLGGLAAGCRTQCMADEETPPAQMAKERRAAARAQTICKELQRPRVTLTDDRLVLSATREVQVAKRSEVPNDGSRFEPLFVRLERYRKHYKAIWPADPFEPFVYVELASDLEAPRAVAIAATAAAAGFSSMRITSGDMSVDVVWASCGEKLRAMGRDVRTARELVASASDACAR